MRRVDMLFCETGSDYSLSPEYWISAESARGLEGQFTLGSLAELVSRQVLPPQGAKFVFDTGNARDGLLDIPVLGDSVSHHTSAKKVVQEGDVIVSRLRPYLRQVAYLPVGASALLGQERFYCSTEFLVFRRKDGQCSAGLAAWLLSAPIQDVMTQAATGGHHPRISADLLLDSPVEARYLEEEFSQSLSDLFLQHLQLQRSLPILLRH